ncbi:MAG: hypothetical protein Q4Q03_00780 [Bowdeniella nasicola]|nr:hypothetical protein [Bowdeniella nasicola]
MSFRNKQRKIKAKSAVSAKAAKSAAKDAGSLIGEGASELGKRAVDYLEAAQSWAEPRMHDAVEDLKSGAQRAQKETVKFAAPKIEAATDAIKPKLDHAYDAIVEDYLPRIQAAMHDAAAAAEGSGSIDTKAKKAGKAAKKALTTSPKKKGGVGRTLGWILVGTLAAGAGYLLWRRTQPIEDPWAEEYWNDEDNATAPSAAHTETVVSAKVEELKEGAKKAADTVAEKVADAKDKTEAFIAEKTGNDDEVAAASGIGAKGNLDVDKETATEMKVNTPDSTLGNTAPGKVETKADKLKDELKSQQPDGKLGEVRNQADKAGKNLKEASTQAAKAIDEKIKDLKKD